ncbi:hypothetical protein C8Q80DRAFT_287690 [Daedaleopsis nitida]|nr:hypothetical protein C8Q80DRAFT_287690 [Daedaleopsis nitida]
MYLKHQRLRLSTFHQQLERIRAHLESSTWNTTTRAQPRLSNKLLISRSQLKFLVRTRFFPSTSACSAMSSERSSEAQFRTPITTQEPVVEVLAREFLFTISTIFAKSTYDRQSPGLTAPAGNHNAWIRESHERSHGMSIFLAVSGDVEGSKQCRSSLWDRGRSATDTANRADNQNGRSTRQKRATIRASDSSTSSVSSNSLC